MKQEAFDLARHPAAAEGVSSSLPDTGRQGELRITSEGDIVAARKAIRDLATALGFSLIDVTRIVTAASELTRNIYLYAGTGVVRWHAVSHGAVKGVECVFEDNGPGIADIEKAMEPGYTSGRGMGLGLPGAKRLMDEMTLTSVVGKGTLVEIRKWLK